MIKFITSPLVGLVFVLSVPLIGIGYSLYIIGSIIVKRLVQIIE